MSGDNFPRRYSIVADTRRQWSDEEKEAIVAEASFPGVNVSAIARRHGIKPSLLFRWRRKERGGGRSRPSPPMFLPVTIAATPEKTVSDEPPRPNTPGSDDNRIEIELGNGGRIRVGADVDIEALKRILALLETL